MLASLTPCSAVQFSVKHSATVFLPRGQLGRHIAALCLETLHCTALYCTELYCTALHCATLHWTALHGTACNIRHCNSLHCTALHKTLLHCTLSTFHFLLLYYSPQHCMHCMHCTATHAMQCNVLYCTVMYCNILHYPNYTSSPLFHCPTLSYDAALLQCCCNLSLRRK